MSVRKQYHLRPSGSKFDAWDVHRLIKLSEDFPVKELPLSDIREVDENYWFNGPDSIPSCRSIVVHLELILTSDLSYPIILSSDGRVMDGMHRIAKALHFKEPVIKAVQFETDPEPDFRNVSEDELEY